MSLSLHSAVEMVVRLLAADTQPHVKMELIVEAGVDTLNVGNLLCLQCVVSDDFRSLEMVLLISDELNLVTIEVSKFKFVHAEGVREANLALVVRENFEKAVLCMHRVPILSVFGILLHIEDVAWCSLEQLDLCVFIVWDLLPMHHHFPKTLPDPFQLA